MRDQDQATRPAGCPLPSHLLAAYAAGIFPMAEPPRRGRLGPIHWYDPDPRGIIPLATGDDAGGLRLPRSLRQRVRSGRFLITSDTAFGAVIRACAEPRPEQGELETWIDERLTASYAELYELGFAHSVEAWLPPAPAAGRPTPTLVGGLYGVHLRGLFAGESMFSRPALGGTDASKVCLVHLWCHLRAIGCTLLDTQFTTPHLERLGAVEIPRAEYRRRLAEALRIETVWGDIDPARAAALAD